MSKSRTFERTHPWLKFSVDTSAFTPKLWILLGEAQSKCEHVAGVPLRPVTAQKLHLLYLAKGAMATTAIEGNTLSEDEIRARIAGQLKLPASREYLGREVDNILDLCNSVLESLAAGDAPTFSADQIKTFNSGVLHGLEAHLDEGVVPGHYVEHRMVVGNYRTAPPQDVPFLVERLAQWLGELATDVPERHRVMMAIVRAVLAHIYLVLIHPFGDGNGRTARMLEFVILIEAGVPSIAAHLLSNHYNHTRTVYYRELSKISRSDGELVPFLEYALQGFVDQLSEQIAKIRDEHMEVAWRNFVHEFFRDASTEAARRQRTLTLELTRMNQPVPATSITGLSGKLAKMYASRTAKTVTRDLNFLLKKQLLVETREGYVANTRLIKAFLPARNLVE